MATLCALDLTLRGTACELITFGCPRVGNKAFVALFAASGDGATHGRTARFVNSADPVARMPPHLEHRPWSFSHICPPTRLDRGALTRGTAEEAARDAVELDEVMLEAAEEALDESTRADDTAAANADDAGEAGGAAGGAPDGSGTIRARASSAVKVLRALPHNAYEAHKMDTYEHNLAGVINEKLY